MDFLRRGLNTASLKDCGTYPDDNDRLIVFSKLLSIRGRIYESNFVGMGSKIQVVGLEHNTKDDLTNYCYHCISYVETHFCS